MIKTHQDEWLEDYERGVDLLIDAIDDSKTITELDSLIPKLEDSQEYDKPYLRLIYGKKRKALR